MILSITTRHTIGGIQITVKTVRSLARGLRALEAIAEGQSIGLTALAEATGDDKSALQRVLATLHEEGWIQPSPGAPPQWELSAKPMIFAGRAGSTSPLQARARQLLAPLRDSTGETVHLSLLNAGKIVVADVAEGTQVVRTALAAGQVHPFERSAAGRAIMSRLSPAQRIGLSVAPETLLDGAEFDRIREQGWAPSAGAVLEGSHSVAAALLDPSGVPIGALVISGPATRLTAERCAELGIMLTTAIASI